MSKLFTLKTGQAAKTSLKASGMIGYRILTDVEQSDVFVRIESNEGGGYFSNELIPFSKIQSCLLGLEKNTSLPAKTFRPAFVGKSSNNAGFLCSILRAEGLMTHDPEKGYSHRVSADWGQWKAEMLALPAQAFALPVTEEEPAQAEAGAKRKPRKSAAAPSSAEAEPC